MQTMNPFASGGHTDPALFSHISEAHSAKPVATARYREVMAADLVRETITIEAPAEAILDVLADPAQHCEIAGSTTV